MSDYKVWANGQWFYSGEDSVDNIVFGSKPTNPLKGSLYVDQNTNVMYIYYDEWIQISGVYADTTAPDPAEAGQCWINTNSYSFNIYDGTRWINLTSESDQNIIAMQVFR